MKQPILWAAACLLSFTSDALDAQSPSPAPKVARYVLRIHLDHLDNHPLLLLYRTAHQQVVDSACSREGEWMVFKDSISGPVVAQLRVRNRNLDVNIKGDNFIPSPALRVLLEDGEVKVTGDAEKLHMAIVTGGENDWWAPIRKKEAAAADADWNYLKAAVAAAQKGDSSLFKKDDHSQGGRARNILQMQKDFILQHPDAWLSIYFLSEMEHNLDFTGIKALYAGLGEKIRSTELGRSLGEKITALDATANGKDAIPINKKDIDGRPVSLESLKGKYVLLDFWGSWCVFCRRSHPHLKELYSQYQDRGFEIVGIAYEQKKTLEEDYKVMKEAIGQDGISWIQVLNNDGIETFDAVKAYGVDAFPTKILLDREGRIIGRYEGSENPDLDKKIQELMGN